MATTQSKELVRASRESQGLPPSTTDPVALQRIAVLLALPLSQDGKAAGK